MPLDQLGPRATVGLELGTLSDKKGLAYGDSITATAKIMEALYPKGIDIEQYDKMLILVRIADKMNRISNGDPKAFNEDPWADIAGYALLMVTRGRGME